MRMLSHAQLPAQDAIQSGLPFAWQGLRENDVLQISPADRPAICSGSGCLLCSMLLALLLLLLLLMLMLLMLLLLTRSAHHDHFRLTTAYIAAARQEQSSGFVCDDLDKRCLLAAVGNVRE